MPCYRVLIRSHLLVQFPDIAVDVKFAATRTRPIHSTVAPPANTPAQQPILVQKRIGPDTMYLLLDAAPPDLRRINFTEESPVVVVKKLYTALGRPDGAQRGDLSATSRSTQTLYRLPTPCSTGTPGRRTLPPSGGFSSRS